MPMNYVRTAMLLAALTAIFVALGAAIGGQTGMIIAFVLALGMNVFSLWNSDKLVLRMYGAKEVNERSAPEYYGLVRDLAQHASLPMPRVYIMQSDQPNAFATGRSPHNQGWRTYFLDNPNPPADDATVIEKMAYKLRTKIGNAIYRLRKSTVEPVIGIIKEVLGFRQFSLRGLFAVGGEWTLICLAYNLKRMHTLRYG